MEKFGQTSFLFLLVKGSLSIQIPSALHVPLRFLRRKKKKLTKGQANCIISSKVKKEVEYSPFFLSKITRENARE